MALTLSIDELSNDVLEAWKILFPFLGSMSTDFSSATAQKGDTITGMKLALPTVDQYDATTNGYRNNVNDAKTLANDVPVTLSDHPVVSTEVKHIDAISSKRDLYMIAVRNMAFSLGSHLVDTAAATWTAANFTESTPDANPDLDTLNGISAAMNGKGVTPFGRVGLVNSATFNELIKDPRIQSRDYYGQMGRGGTGYGMLQNCGGFGTIWEWPSLPTTGNLTGFFYTQEATIICSRVPSELSNPTPALRNAAIVTTTADADTGLTFGGLEWAEMPLANNYMALTVLFGATGGTQGGGAGEKTDYDGHRLVSA